MQSQIRGITALLLSTVIFLMGNGLVGTLIPLRASIEGFSSISIGAMGAWYFAGFVAGCYGGPRLLSRVGHIRSFAVASALIAASIMMMPLWTTPDVLVRAARADGLLHRDPLHGARKLAERSRDQRKPRAHPRHLYRRQSQRAPDRTVDAALGHAGIVRALQHQRDAVLPLPRADRPHASAGAAGTAGARSSISSASSRLLRWAPPDA